MRAVGEAFRKQFFFVFREINFQLTFRPRDGGMEIETRIPHRALRRVRRDGMTQPSESR